MDFSFDNLNYNSVVNVPGFEARAVFTVNSATVFNAEVCFGSGLRYDFYGGWLNVRILSSGEFRRIRYYLIFRVNDCEIFL